ncbi:MAG: TRAP transporter large permease subunit [Deltaproteobacteria bacterium]|nr:TRAP transporter large permease subunit [Deltaproteobacteria bacterium]
MTVEWAVIDGGLSVKSLLKRLEGALNKILTCAGLISVLLMIMLAVFIFTQAFSRYVLSTHVPGLFDVSIYSLILFTFLGGAYTLREGSHISVDLIWTHLPARSRAGLDIAAGVAGLLFSAAVVWFSWRWSQLAFSSGVMTISEIPVPKGVLIGSISIGFVLVGLQIIRQLIHACGRTAGTWFPRERGLFFKESPLVPLMIFLVSICGSLVVSVLWSKWLGICLFATIMLLSGMPVCFALGFTGSVGLYLLVGGPALGQIPFLAFKAVESFPLTCLPLFIIAGLVMERGKMVDEVFKLFRMISGNSASAPLLTTILAGGFFCAVSGSSVATTSLIAAATLPMFMTQGYRKSIASGTVAGATIGTVIPPSIGYILYGVITEESIGRLFIAGIIPAAMIFGFYFTYIILRAMINADSFFESDSSSHRAQTVEDNVEKESFFQVLRRSVWGLLAPIFVLGGIYMGVFTPSEAAAVMLVYAIVISLWVMKTLTPMQLLESVRNGAKVSSMILLIIVGAKIFGAVTSQLRIASDLVNFVSNAGISPLGSLFLIALMLILLGMFLDAASTMVITLPIFYPLLVSVGFNSVWLGVFYIIVLEIGLLTPPVGLNLFVIRGVSGFSMGSIVRGSFPFILMMLLALIMLALFPELAVWLPRRMMG